MQSIPKLVLSAFSALTLVAAASAAPIVTYDFQTLPGNETSVAANFSAAHITAGAFGESGVTPSAGAGSINASAWNNPLANFNWGFTAVSGFTATVTEIVFSSRSSGTGPGFLSVQESVDGGAFVTVASLTQGNATFSDNILALTPFTGTTFAFRIVAANQISAAGGTVATGGTFRVADYQSSAVTPFSINGTVNAIRAVPEPSVIGLLAIAMGAGLLTRRRSK